MRLIHVMGRIALPMTLAALAVAHSSAQDAPFSCVVIEELVSGKQVAAAGEACTTRLSPASTFKIPHALVALETGVVTRDSIEKWNGQKYERQAKWNQDHTVISALRPSVLWFFQRIAPRIGAARMTEWLTRFDYGNRTVAGPIDQYWINGQLAISTPEQVAFLRKFYSGTLPVKREHVDAVRQGLAQQEGTIENALGVHRLAGDWRGVRLNAKTGATTTEKYRVSWLVGLVSSGGKDYVFASAMWRTGGEVDTLDGARLAARTFREVGIVK